MPPPLTPLFTVHVDDPHFLTRAGHEQAVFTVHVDGLSYGAGTDKSAEENGVAFTAAMQALARLIDTCEQDITVGGVIEFSPGVYEFNRTLSINRHSIWLKGCRTVLKWTNQGGGRAIEFVPTQADWQLGFRQINYLGGISGITIYNDDDCLDWEVDSTGLYLENVHLFKAYDLSVHNFQKGIHLHGAPVDGEECGCDSGILHLGTISNNHVGVSLDVDRESGLGFITEVTFSGGTWTVDLDQVAPSPESYDDSRHVYALGSGPTGTCGEPDLVRTDIFA